MNSETPLDRERAAALFAALLRAPAAAAHPSLGLAERDFMRLREKYVGVVELVGAPGAGHRILSDAQAHFVDALVGYLLPQASSAADAEDARFLAIIVANACLRPDHLWRDLGLQDREAVTAMLSTYFPAIVEKNSRNVRWKKFLASDMAISLGQMPAPAPGCPGCEDFGVCFPA